ncbi:hypothetical protein BKA61DRAFT_736609 [Leptodontidium sp. MPI-SDFR-AT-0119]|nr:hypothetical protein BKA61DRAFT_736609 [Leptodontidium sp. MPI-SDFR-AT-0119]
MLTPAGVSENFVLEKILAQLQVSKKWKRINTVWDRCEKVLYLLIDVSLNWYFIRIVQRRLVNQGLVKYKKLVRFNMWMVSFSLLMDVLIISMMSLKNSFAYMQFHPLAYTVKLNIENKSFRKSRSRSCRLPLATTVQLLPSSSIMPIIFPNISQCLWLNS